MIDNITLYAFQIILFIAAPVFYVTLLALLTPRLLKPAKQETVKIGDRGIKRYSLPNGRAIVYAPDMKNKKYIKQYLVFCENEEKYIRCKLAGPFLAIRYEVSAFDAEDKLITTVEVENRTVGRLYTHDVMLPAETAYVSLRVCEVNGDSVAVGDIPTPPSAARMSAFFALTLGLTVAVAFTLRWILFSFADLIYYYSYWVKKDGLLLTLGVSAAVGIFLFMILPTFYGVSIFRQRRSKKKS